MSGHSMVSVRCISKCEWYMVNVRCMVEYEWYVGGYECMTKATPKPKSSQCQKLSQNNAEVVSKRSTNQRQNQIQINTKTKYKPKPKPNTNQSQNQMQMIVNTECKSTPGSSPKQPSKIKTKPTPKSTSI